MGIRWEFQLENFLDRNEIFSPLQVNQALWHIPTDQRIYSILATKHDNQPLHADSTC